VSERFTNHSFIWALFNLASGLKFEFEGKFPNMILLLLYLNDQVGKRMIRMRGVAFLSHFGGIFPLYEGCPCMEVWQYNDSSWKITLMISVPGNVEADNHDRTGYHVTLEKVSSNLQTI
jgi:hypothetical protein